MNDPLAEPAGNVATMCFTDAISVSEPDLFVDCNRFICYIMSKFDEFDILTYSNSSSDKFPKLNIGRIIHGLPLFDHFTNYTASKHIPNNHGKMFICYREGKVEAIYLGSLNHGFSFNLNLMYRVRKKHHKQLLEFFNYLWTH